MHGLTDETEQLAHQVLELVLARQRQDPWPIGGVATAEELAERVGPTITPDGLGGSEALGAGSRAGAGNGAADHPRYLAFIPHAPTEVAVLFDLLVGASGIYAGSWLEAAGAVYAENEALRWLADLAGFPAEAGEPSCRVARSVISRRCMPPVHAALRRRGGRAAGTLADRHVGGGPFVSCAGSSGPRRRPDRRAGRCRHRLTGAACEPRSTLTGTMGSSPSSPQPGRRTLG